MSSPWQRKKRWRNNIFCNVRKIMIIPLFYYGIIGHRCYLNSLSLWFLVCIVLGYFINTWWIPITMVYNPKHVAR